MWQKSYDETQSLYLIPTPIGNLEDMTFRSINILKQVEVVFSEDTRVTANLLNYYDIKKKLISLHDHNEEVVKEKVYYYLNQGNSVAIVTDRGTPIISDPGYKTVKYISDKGFNVIGLPGACAFVPALIVSGISAEHFFFYGFLNSKEGKRKKELEQLKNIETTIIFYEAPHRIKSTITNILEIFGNRNISISREISKRYESVYRGKISDVLSTLDNIKGEFVIVVEAYKQANNDINIDLVSEVNKNIKDGMSTTDSIKIVAKKYNLSKNDVYNKYHLGR